MGNYSLLIIYILLFVAIFYFLAVRPQRRQKQQHLQMMSTMKKGDEVVTVGGMYGTVRKLGTDWVELEIAPRTRVRFLKRAISSITSVPEEEEELVDEEEYDETEELEAGEEEYAEDEVAEEEYAEAAEEEGPEAETEAPEAPEAPPAQEPGKDASQKS